MREGRALETAARASEMPLAGSEIVARRSDTPASGAEMARAAAEMVPRSSENVATRQLPVLGPAVAGIDPTEKGGGPNSRLAWVVEQSRLGMRQALDCAYPHRREPPWRLNASR